MDTGEVTQLVELTRLVAAVSAAPDLAGAATAFGERAVHALGASAASLSVVDGPGWLRLVGRHGDGDLDTDRWGRFSLDEDNAVADAVRTGAVVTAETPAEVCQRWPELFPGPSPTYSAVAALPLFAGERCLGAIGLAWPQPRTFEGSDRQYLGALADCVAQAVDRIVAHEAATASGDKLAFLSEASEALAASLDYEATLRTVADLAVPRLADWCAIDLLDGERLRRVAVSHVDPSKVRLAWELWERFPPDLDLPHGPGEVLRTGRSELIQEVDDELLDAMDVEPELRRLIVELQLRSGVTAALQARNRTMGVITFVSEQRRFSGDDVRLAEDLARRAAVAIDNSQLHTETRQATVQLQRALLPPTSTEAGGWRVAAHYRPAGRTEVGGDFFDALARPDGRVAVVVGDVMGRGLAAAATMAQVRAALRGFVTEDADPVAVLHRLDVMFADLELPELVTLVYAVLDAGAGTVRLGHAGHLPPIVVGGDGSARRLELPTSPPLGLAQGKRSVLEFPLEPAGTLLLYTDGLVERRGEDIDEGMSRLTEQAGALTGRVDERALAEVADAMRKQGHDDDVTLLAAQWSVGAVRAVAPGPMEAAPGAPRAEGSVGASRAEGSVGAPRAEGSVAAPADADPHAAPGGGSSGRAVPCGAGGLPRSLVGSGPLRAERVVAATLDEVPRARRWARGVIAERAPELEASAELVVSELVTNAVLHGQPPLDLRLELDGGCLRVEVVDRGRDLPVRTAPDGEGMTGRGLALVAAVCNEWGVGPAAAGGKVVWAELSVVPSGTPGVSVHPAQDVGAWAEAVDGPVEHTIDVGAAPTGLVLAACAHHDNLAREADLARLSDPTAAGGDVLTAVATGFAHGLAQLRLQALGAADRGEAVVELRLRLPLAAAADAERWLAACELADRAADAARTLTLSTPRSQRVFRRWLVEQVGRRFRALAAGEPSPALLSFGEVMAVELDGADRLEDAAERLSLIEELSQGLRHAHGVDDVAAIAVATITRSPAVRTARVFVVDGELVRSLAWKGEDRPLDESYDSFPLTSDLPGARVLRSGRPRTLGTLAEIRRWFPGLAAYYTTERSMHLVPLGSSAPIGLLVLTFDGSRMAAAAQEAFAGVVADCLSGALDRERRRAAG